MKVRKQYGAMNQYIEKVEGRCGGRPTFNGTRVEPWHIKGWFLENDNEVIAGHFPGVSPEALVWYRDYLKDWIAFQTANA